MSPELGMAVDPLGANRSLMISALPIKFLQQKIRELQSALFFAETNTVLRMPTHVITAAEMDESGQIWFIIPKPVLPVEAFDKGFPVKMDFFKKGKGFYLKIKGKASLIVGREEIKDMAGLSEEAAQKIRTRQAVAIKVKIQNADYFENIPRPVSSNWLVNSTNHLYNWLFNSQYDHKHPQLLTIPINLD